MTVAEAKHKVTQAALSEVGYTEGSDNWNKYAEELDPLGITWGNKQNLPWCGEFVLWVFYKCFGVSKGLEILCSPNPTGIPLCKMGASYFQEANRWYQKPEVGDIIFFYYSGDINHTGIVVGVSGGIVTTVEGNSSDGVRQNYYAISNQIITGYGRPKWSVAANAEDTPVEDTKPSDPAPAPVDSTNFSIPDLAKGDTGEVVRAAQFLLNGRKCSVGIWGADGDFGNGTEAAVLAFQRRNSLEDDGIIGQQTWRKLLGL